MRATEVSKLVMGILCVGLGAGCVSQRTLEGQGCPCAPGWTCDYAANVCYRGDAGTGGSGGSSPNAADSGIVTGAGGTSDSGVTVADAGADSGIVTVGPSYVCGPADAGVRCYCGTQPYFPAPVNDMGQQQSFVLPPDPATVVPYQTMAEFDALATGRWQRTAGQGELVCEQIGVDFTPDHRMVPLVLATDGTVQEVNALAVPFVITFGSRPVLEENGGTLTTNVPVFFDGGQSMYLTVSPWPADYARVR